MFWKVLLYKRIALQFYLSYIIEKDCLFHESKILFLRRKMNVDLSEKSHGNMIFSVYSVMMVFPLPANMILPFCRKSKDDFLKYKKKHLKMTFLVSLKKMIFILENIVFLLIKKFTFIKKFQWFFELLLRPF